MKVSIITVCYNSAVTIEDTITSVLSQDYKDIEYIIIDGGSKDTTLDIINKYRDKISTFISEPDQGIYDAMNKGIKHATGDIVGILNSDDFFSDDKSISYIVQGFDLDTVEAVYADLIYVKQDTPKKFSRLYSSKYFKQWKIKFGFMIPHPTFYAKRALFDKFGFYKLNYRVAADFELMARFFVAGIITKRVNKVIVSMREGGISSSGLRWRIHQNSEVARACRENGIYSNLLMVAAKLPFKLLSFFKKNNP